jgi:hypothetical protein
MSIDFVKFNFSFKSVSLLSLLIFSFITDVVLSEEQPQESGTLITVTVNAAEGLVYLLLIIFFGVNFCTPVIRYIYVSYLANLVEQAQKEAMRQTKKMSERMSDAGRKVSQSVRSV